MEESLKSHTAHRISDIPIDEPSVSHRKLILKEGRNREASNGPWGSWILIGTFNSIELFQLVSYGRKAGIS